MSFSDEDVAYEDEDLDNPTQEKVRGKRGPYRPSITGFLLEYKSTEGPLSPWKYSSLVPDSVLSYTITHAVSAPEHFDLVILRFGRAEKCFKEVEAALKGLSSIRVEKITVFRNKKNTNRLYYLKNNVFPKKLSLPHHSLREWDVVNGAKAFSGMGPLLDFMEQNDVLETSWSRVQRSKAAKLLTKYNLQF
jgi:hypothetical protein